VADGNIKGNKGYEYCMASPTHDELRLSRYDTIAQYKHYKHPKEQCHTDYSSYELFFSSFNDSK